MTPRRTFAAGERDEAARERTSVATPTRTLVSLVRPFVATIALLLAIAAANLWTLSALRAYVNGEALWSKAQKEAVLHLEHYARTGDPMHYRRFAEAIDVTLGDRVAREELEKPSFVRNVAIEGFRRGGNHDDDIAGMIALFRYFRRVSFVDHAIATWQQGDAEIAQLLATARRIDAAVRANAGRTQLDPLIAEVGSIDARLRPLENDFSSTLGEGSRATLRLLVASMSAAAVLLMAIGLAQVLRLIRAGHASEQALRASEARFRALTDLTSDWYWEQDEHFRFTGITPRAGAFTQLPEKRLGRTRWELPAIDISDEQWQAHRRMLEAHLPFRDLEIRRPDVDGKPIWVSISGEPRFDTNGRFVGYRGIGKIITDRKLAELEVQRLNRELESRVRARTAELESANRELESFAYSIAHDLAAPLRSINGRVSALAEDCAERLGPEGLAAIERVREATVRMGRLIDDMLGLSMASRREMQRTTVDLTEIAHSIVADLRAAVPERAADMRIARVPPVAGDRDMLRIALANLLDNAWKFCAGRAMSEIEFGSEIREGERWYFVRDNGVGFDQAYAEQVFKPFFRLHDERVFPGTGIGLAIVERVIARHGGRVVAEPEPGRGTTIRFTLASADAASGRPAVS